jgi:hypothetical protein
VGEIVQGVNVAGDGWGNLVRIKSDHQAPPMRGSRLDAECRPKGPLRCGGEDCGACAVTVGHHGRRQPVGCLKGLTEVLAGESRKVSDDNCQWGRAVQLIPGPLQALL